MKRFINVTGLLVLALSLSATTQAAEDYAQDQVFVKLRTGGSLSSLRFRVAGVKNFRIDNAGARAAAFNKEMERFSLVTLAKGMSVEQAMAALRTHPDVEYVGPNARAHALLTPNDPRVPVQWNLHNDGQNIAGVTGTPDADIDAPEAWDIETGVSNTITVAIVDSGIDYSHPDLVGNIWINPSETANGLDDDGNGIIDDIRGANFIRTSGPPSGDPMDDFFHGTHLAGIIGARTNNGAGIAGICWNVRLMGLKFLDSSGNGSVSHAIEAIQYAVANGAHVINNSWGTTTDMPALAAAVAAAHAAGVVVTGAAGNSANSPAVQYPAGYAEVLAVSATNNRDLNVLNNHGSHIDLAAPGKDIASTGLSGAYVRTSGSSMATAHVAGAAALLRSKAPSLTPAQIRVMLMSTVDVPPGWNTNYGVGRLNVHQALLELSDRTPPTVAFSTPTHNAVVSRTIQLTADAADNVEVAEVRFFVDGVLLGSDTIAPFTRSFDTTTVVDGPHLLEARAFDTSGNNALASVTLTVANRVADLTPPAVGITAPADGALMSGTVDITANASDDIFVSRVDFYVDGQLIASDGASPYAVSWDSTAAAAGLHVVVAQAFDPSGNMSSSSILLRVSGGPAGALSQFNPLFNPARGERVTIPLDMARSSHVKATVIDRFGSEVAVIADNEMAAGALIHWNGRNGSNETAASGTYIVIIVTGGSIQTRKIIVRK